MQTTEIQALVKATLEAKIIEAFKSTPEMIDQLVQACLSQEVNQHGGKPDYYDKTKMPYLTYLAQSAVQDVARKAVIEYVETMTPVIRKNVQAKLSAGAMVDALTESIIAETKCGYNVEIKFVPKKDE